MRRRSHSSHFLTEGDKNILAEWKTMDVRLVGGTSWRPLLCMLKADTEQEPAGGGPWGGRGWGDVSSS